MSLKELFAILFLLLALVLVLPQAFSANDTTKPSVSNFSINGTTGGKVTVAPGGSFTISYYVFNPMSTSQYGLLGASLISGGVEYNDKSHDKWQSLATYGNWYSRTFLVPSNTPGGSYDLQLGLWKDTSYSLRWNPNYDAGAVVTVTCGSSTYTYKCYNNNLYYYDQCGNRQSMKTACGSSYDEVNFCSSSSNVAKIHHDKGCSNTQCYDNLSSVQVQACNAFEVCNNGACQSKCTENATRCASDTVKEICSQGLWVQQSLAYCYFDGTKAVQVGCVQNSNCGSGLTCDTASHTCISPCSGDTGNHRCSSDLTKTEKEVYNGSCTLKTWVTDLTCSNTQYCSLSGIVPTCLTRIFNGFSCTPGGSSTRLCQSTLCNPFSVCSSSICAGETAKITADSSGNITQTNLPSGKYCLDTSSGANEVNCLRDSQCTNGGKCNTTSYTCQSPCTQGTATGNKRCGTNLATVESEYTNADCSKYWSTTKTCFTDPTVALQYCNNAPITGPDCAIRLSEGAACQPASSTTLACTSGICTSNSTCGCTLSQKKCASTTVAQICGSLGTWTSTTCNAGYACSNGDCIPNCSVGSYTGNYRCSSDSKSIEGEYYTSNCSKDWKVSSSCSLTQTCDASQKKCLDWAITSPIWSKTAANPLEQVSLSVTTANIPNGTIIKFGVIDGSSITSPATIYDTLSGTVTNNSVQVPWTVYPFTPIAGSFVALKFTACDGSDRICVTSGAMNANALVSSATWSKSTVQIGDTVTMIANFNAPDGTKIKFDLSEFDQLSANDKLGIFYGTLQGGKAETTITIPALKDLFTTPQIQFLASIDAYPSKTTRSSKLTVNNDTKLNIDYYDNYVEQDFLQAFEWSVSGAKPTETGLEYGNSKTVRCSGTQPICYKRAPGTLTEENKYLALLKNASVGTIYARAYALRSDGNTYYSDWVSSTIYAHDTSKLIVYLNKIDFADPIWNITKIFTVGNCIDNKVLSWGCAFDVILLLPAGSLKVLSKSPEVIKLLRGLDAAKEVDVALNGLKSTKKISEVLDAADNLALFKIIDSTGEVQINYPKLTELFVKGTGFNSKVVSLKGASMTLPNLEWYAAKGFSVDDAAKVVEDFSTIGVKTTITASQKGLSYLPSMIAGGKFSGKAVTTMGAIGLESGKINGLVIVDGIEGGALSAFEDGKIIIGTDKAFYFGDKASDSTFMNIIVDNALPHEIVHAKYADKIQLLSFADREAEDYLIDATLKAKLVGKDLTNYKLAETYLIKNYPYGTIMNYLYEVGKQKEEVATMARLYSEATDYLLASSKSVIESNYLNFLKAKYPKITLAQKNAKLTAFKNFAAQIKKTGLDYFNTGRWTAISEFIP